MIALPPANPVEAVFTNIGTHVKGVVKLENGDKLILTLPAEKTKFLNIPDSLPRVRRSDLTQKP